MNRCPRCGAYDAQEYAWGVSCDTCGLLPGYNMPGHSDHVDSPQREPTAADIDDDWRPLSPVDDYRWRKGYE